MKHMAAYDIQMELSGTKRDLSELLTMVLDVFEHVNKIFKDMNQDLMEAGRIKKSDSHSSDLPAISDQMKRADEHRTLN